MEQKILTSEAAFKQILKRLRKRGFELGYVYHTNSCRYMIVRCVNRKNLLLMYKREPFYNFGYDFKKLGECGVGDTINREDLRKAIMKDVGYIYTVFPNGYVYSITMQEFLERSYSWKNKEGKDVRSISIHAYKREFEL